VIDAGVDTEWVRERMKSRADTGAARTLMNPASIADAYWRLHQQPRDAWSHEVDLRPFNETW
jgi:hypothetical protein